MAQEWHTGSIAKDAASTVCDTLPNQSLAAATLLCPPPTTPDPHLLCALQPELLSALAHGADEMLRQFGPQELTNTVWSLSQMHRNGVPFPPDVDVSSGWGVASCAAWGEAWQRDAAAAADVAGPPARAVELSYVAPCPPHSVPPPAQQTTPFNHIHTHTPHPTPTPTPSHPHQALLDRIPDEVLLLWGDRSWRARVRPQTISNLALAYAHLHRAPQAGAGLGGCGGGCQRRPAERLPCVRAPRLPLYPPAGSRTSTTCVPSPAQPPAQMLISELVNEALPLLPQFKPQVGVVERGGCLWEGTAWAAVWAGGAAQPWAGGDAAAALLGCKEAGGSAVRASTPRRARALPCRLRRS